MANFVLTYDLNGSVPSHSWVDTVLQRIGATRARILETVWYVGWPGGPDDLFNAVNSMLSLDDRLIVVEANEAVFRNLLVDDQGISAAWQHYR
jgi:hypothetical protein